MPQQELANETKSNTNTPLEQQDSGRKAQEPTSVGAYLATLVLGLLPVVGIAFGILWGYGYSRKLWRSNLAKAMLLLHAVAMLVAILLLAGRIMLLLSTHPTV